MIYIPYFYGGLCNNLLQLSNCFTLFYDKKIPLKYLSIKWQLEERYDNPYQNKDILYNSLRKYQYDGWTLPQDCINIKYNNAKIIRMDNGEEIEFDPSQNYCLNECFYGHSRLVYDILGIKNIIFETIKKYNFDTVETACIHIRRGDYFWHKNGSLIKSDERIIEDIKYAKRHKNNVWIATNDVEYIKELAKDYNVNYFYDLGCLMVEEFLLGCTCEKLVPNEGSTFSFMLINFSDFLKCENPTFKIEDDYILKV